MKGLKLIYIVLILFIFQAACLHAARNRPSYDEDRGVILREILDSLDNLQHEVNNHEAEIRMFEEKFKNQEDILDSVRRQSSSSLQAVKGHSVSVEAKLAGHENLAVEFKSFAKESNLALAEYKNRIIELEKSIEVQNKNIENLQTGLKTLIEALQIKEEGLSSHESNKIYRVKAGDSLEKIARHHQTTIKKIKELNNLTSDQIIINQKLKMPE